MENMDEKPLDWWKERTGLDLDTHNGYPHDFLMDFIGQCISGDGNDVRVLVPLCGKSAADIKWLYDEGYRVYGVDASEKALQAIFKQNDMQFLYTPSISGGFGVFKNQDERIKLFCGDFFRLSKNVTGCFFDVIWDRGAFMTINVQDREQYVNVMKDLLLPTGRILLATSIYDSSKWRGPPYVVTRQDVQRYFDKDFHVNTLKTCDSLQHWHQERWGIDWLKEIGYMLSPKA